MNRSLSSVVAIVAPALCLPLAALADGPTFNCAKAQGEVEKLICSDASLAALDRQLDQVYKAATAKAKAAKDSEARLAKADAAVAEKLAAAEADLTKARSAALANIEAVAAEAAQDIVAKVSGASVTAAKAQTAVRAALSHA